MSDLPDLESMSDEDFLNAGESLSFDEPTEAEPVQEPVQEDPVEDSVQEEAEPIVEDGPEEEEPVQAEEEDTSPAPAQPVVHATLEDALDAAAIGSNSTTESDHTKAKQTEAPEAEEDEEPKEQPEASDAPEDTSSDVDYEAAYKQIMAPFKASGRTVEPRSPEEAVRLMQMGADYAKKMASLKPVLKITRMLENNGLMDEAKLSYLIDLDRRDPTAIQKLLHDSKIDPLDLNTSDEPAYKPKSYGVTDQEMQFHDMLGELSSTPEGTETVNLINQSWDATSKQAVFDEPGIMQIINEQRANGIFGQISAEIERQQMLGHLNPNLPFLQAYKQVGDHLQAQGLLKPVNQEQAQPAALAPAPQQQAPRVVGSRPATVRKAPDNGDRAKAASPARTAPKSSPRSFNIFDMTDEEIEAINPPH